MVEVKGLTQGEVKRENPEHGDSQWHRPGGVFFKERQGEAKLELGNLFRWAGKNGVDIKALLDGGYQLVHVCSGYGPVTRAIVELGIVPEEEMVCVDEDPNVRGTHEQLGFRGRVETTSVQTFLSKVDPTWRTIYLGFNVPGNVATQIGAKLSNAPDSIALLTTLQVSRDEDPERIDDRGKVLEWRDQGGFRGSQIHVNLLGDERLERSWCLMVG